MTGHSLFLSDMELSLLKSKIEEKLSELHYELVSLSLSTVKGDKVLALVVDRVEPIDMDAIVDLSHALNEYIDELNPFVESYTLDISSLGAEKPLKMESLKDYLNRFIHVHLINPIEGENIYEGDLIEVNEDNIKLSYRIKTRIKTVDIRKENISKIRLAIKF